MNGRFFFLVRSVRLLQTTDDPCRYASDDGIGRHVPGHHGTGRYHSAVSDRHPLQDHGACPDPGIFPDHNGPRNQVMSSVRVQDMVQSRENGMVADQSSDRKSVV